MREDGVSPGMRGGYGGHGDLTGGLNIGKGRKRLGLKSWLMCFSLGFVVVGFTGIMCCIGGHRYFDK